MQSLGQWQQPLVPGQNPGKVKVVVLHSGSLRQGCRYAGPTSHLKRCLKRKTVHACDSACFLLTEQCRAMFTGTERETQRRQRLREMERQTQRDPERETDTHTESEGAHGWASGSGGWNPAWAPLPGDSGQPPDLLWTSQGQGMTRARGGRPVIVAGGGHLQGEKLCPGEPDCPGHRRVLTGHSCGWQRGARGTHGQGVELAGQMRGVSAHGCLHGLAGCCQHRCPGAGQLGQAHDANTHGAPALGPAPHAGPPGESECRGVGLSLRQAPYTRHGALLESKPPQTLFQGERPRDGSVSLEILFAPKVIRRSLRLGWGSLHSGLCIWQICCFHRGKPLAKRMNLESTCNMLFITKSVRTLAGCPQPRVGLLSPARPWVLLALLCPLGMSASSNPTTVTPLREGFI